MEEVIGQGNTQHPLTEAQVQALIAEGLAHAPVDGKRVLVILPDSTRTAPIPQIVQSLRTALSGRTAALDYLIAAGTHPSMDDTALSSHLGIPVRQGKLPDGSSVYNHHWDHPETFVTVGTLPAAEIETLSQGHLSLDVPIHINRLALDYDFLIVCGPVFPHEVVGFSGGNKYFFPGIAGPEIIDVTHWLGALLTCRAVIGIADNPVRQTIDRAASLIPTPRLGLSMVIHNHDLHGLYIGPIEAAWQTAVSLSAQLNIVTLPHPVQRVLSILPPLYDDLWTGSKGFYKVEPVVADGGEVILYAPHITELSYTHGRLLDEIGYHLRDYILAHWERYKHYPWAILAHSTHLRGDGTYQDGEEHPRVRLTLATGIPQQRCERVGLNYLDPQTIDLDAWRAKHDPDTLIVERAGEILYRLQNTNES